VTLVVDRPVTGPATHVLLVGVAHYRHLPGGEGPFLRDPLGLRQIAAPALSVQLLLDTFADVYRRTAAPLATVDVLLSGGTVTAPGGSPVEVEAATMANVKAAVRAWAERAGEHPDNVAVFSFCGHGVERAHQYLLLEDFGAYEPALLENTIDVELLHQGMVQCRAGTQLFLIDACRELPRSFLHRLNGDGPTILDAVDRGNFDRDAPILWATTAQDKAFALEGQSTRYAQALRQALLGAAAVLEDGRWAVRYTRLISAMGQLLRQGPPGVPPQQVRSGGEGGDALIHELAGVPQVPVMVTCAPEDVARAGTLRLNSLVDQARCYSRSRTAGAWSVEVPADLYRLSAELDPPWVATEIMQPVWPPFQELTLKATQ
jgi:hypothetical protein